MTLFTIALVLLFIMDPIGNINPCSLLLENMSLQKKRHVLIREMLIALGIMLFFTFFGKYVLSTLDLSLSAVHISAGMVLLLFAIKILFPSEDSFRQNLPQGEPFITPLAVPLIAGPSLIATIMLYTVMEHCSYTMISSVLLAWFFACLILFFGEPIKKLLTKNGLIAIEKLIGMVLVLISVQRIMEGVLIFIKTQKNG